jgi:uncharacterized membrane protein YgaE (UPF0421/DUF939 family)
MQASEFSAAKEAMKTAFACSLAIWISYTYAWPEPYWSCMAIVLSRHSDRHASWWLFSKQSCGVALGTFIGITMLTVSQSAFLFCLLYAVWTGALAYHCAFQPPSPLCRFAAFTTTTVAMAGLFQNNPEVNIALIRGAQILLGVLLAAIINLRPNSKGDSHQNTATSSPMANQQRRRLARQHAGRVVLVMFAMLVVWLWLDIPAGPFAMVSASVIATPAIDSAAIRFSQRFTGIILGASLAVVFTAIFLPELERIQEFELWIFGGFWVCSFLNYRSEKSAFVGLQSGQTLAVVLVREAHQSADLLAIWQRGRAIAIGLIISFLVIDILTRTTIRGSTDDH